jgi:predicted DNA-binding ribbon-helix-helix protein
MVSMRQPRKEATVIKTSLNLNKPLWTRLRMRALEEGVSATQLLEQAIEEFLKKKRETKG